MEVWKYIKGYEGLYQISNLGQIKNNKGKYSIIGIDNCGYYRLNLKKNGKQKTHRVHRLLALVFIENTYNKPFINHIDGNKLNNSLDNLEWCTAKENIIHAVQNKLRIALKKENHGRAILDTEKVALIRSNQISLSYALKVYGISKTQYYRVKNGEGW
jgi:hypothetical protein